MIKGVRVPERAYRIVLWVVSVVFAGFIIGLGNLIIGDLPQVEAPLSPDQFVEGKAAEGLRAELRLIESRRGAIDDRLAVSRLQLEQAQKASTTGTETFQAWIAMRGATESAAQNPEVLARTRALEALKANERTLQATIAELENTRLPLSLRESDLLARQSALQAAAYPAYERAMFWQELRIFGLRLALTLPMLVIAAWLVM